MPRTKVSKAAKRNREITNREEKVREFGNSLDGFQNTVEDKIQEILTSYEYEVKMLLERTPRALLKMKMVDAFSLDLNHLTDWEQQKSKLINSSSQNSTLLMRSARAINPNDEGYLTEDSSTGGSVVSGTGTPAYLTLQNNPIPPLVQNKSARVRTPGPLSSARSRRPRRSRSASGNLAPISGSALKHKTAQLSVICSEHIARNKMRTPMASRAKALSADRTSKSVNTGSPQSPLFLRYPKHGELVLSKCGSPLVAQTISESYAHLNIPLRNGVISMRPKKFEGLQQHIIEDLDSVTVNQLKTLKTNIEKIVSMVDKTGF